MVATSGAAGDNTFDTITVLSSDRGSAEVKKVFGPSPDVVLLLLGFSFVRESRRRSKLNDGHRKNPKQFRVHAGIDRPADRPAHQSGWH